MTGERGAVSPEVARGCRRRCGVDMNRSRFAVGLVAALMALLPLPAQAGSGHSRDLPDRIPLPNGWQPEGITTDGHALYAGSLVDGAIWRASLRTGRGRVLAQGAEGRAAVGVDYDRRCDRIWVAGGGTKKVRVHDADSGKVLRTYRFPSPNPRFVNDLVVTWRGVYATDSLNQELLVVPLGRQGRCHGHHHRGLPPRSAATTLPLSGDLEYLEGQFNLNGIVRSRHRLVAVQSVTGQLFRITPSTGHTREIDVEGGPLLNGDGLEPDGDLLYVVRNRDNLIAVVDLNHRRTAGEVVAELTDPELDVPTTVALAKHSLWAVNARFGTPAEPDTEYWVTRLDEYAD